MKKDFKASPAMSFISQESIERVDGKPEESITPTGGERVPDGYKINPAYIETKSKRVQILIQPSLYAEAKALSAQQGISLNEFISRAIGEATHKETGKR